MRLISTVAGAGLVDCATNCFLMSEETWISYMVLSLLYRDTRHNSLT